MTRFIRIFNQYRELIIVIVSFIAFIIFAVHMLNKISINLGNTVVQNNTLNSSENTTQNLTNEEQDQNEQNKAKIKLVMESFVSYCNKKDYSQAYELLTQENQKYYENAENFYTRYIKNMFSEYLDYQMTITQKDEGLNIYAYKITYSTNSMATGSTTKKTKVVTYKYEKQEDGNFRINIRN